MPNIQSITSWIKNHKISSILVAIVILGGFVWYSKSHSQVAKAQYVTQAAEKTTISVSVAASGQVSAENQIDLKPGSSGSLTAVNVKAGDQVKAGQILAIVDQGNNYVALAQARASVMKAQADYDKLVAGLTGIDLVNAQKSVTDAQTALDKAKENIVKANNDYNTTINDQAQAVSRANTKVLNSGLQAVANNTISTATVTLSGTYTGGTEGSYNISFYDTGLGTNYTVTGLGNASGLLNKGYNLPLGNGLYFNVSTTGNLNQYATTYKIDVPNKTSSEYISNLNAYNDALSNQTKAIQAAQDNITSAQEAEKTAEQNLKDAQIAYNEKTSPPDNPSVASAKASILSAQASLQSAANNYNNNNLKAPFDGVVAVVNNKQGDQVSASSVVATIITKQQLGTVSLNEVDAAKVKVGQKTTLSFDAISDLSLTGQVAEVSSIGTTTQGVVSYAVKIGFDSQDERIKPGMSVTANIITDVKTDVLAVPSSAVKTSGNGSYIQMLDASGQPQNKTVEVGISNDTETEIVSGLNDGEQVVTQTITAASQNTARTTTTGFPGLGGTRSGAATGGANRTFNAGGNR
jgi:HlyD family secretion protein